MQWLIQKCLSKLDTIFEWLALLIIIVLLIQWYLLASGSVGWGWLLLVGFVAVVCVVGSFIAVYKNTKKYKHTEYRITYQLIATLKAKETIPDVIYGLERFLLSNNELTRYSRSDFSRVLKNIFGPNRAQEVEPILMTYAEAPPTPESTEKKTDNGGQPPPLSKEAVAKTADNGAQAPATQTAQG